jgi:hypothetical protein
MIDKKTRTTPIKRKLALSKEVLQALTPDMISEVHGGFQGSNGITCGTSCPCRTPGCEGWPS